MNYPWEHKRRFNSYAEYFKKYFGERVQKVAIDAGFTCPNRDGSKGYGGCTYCNNNAFNPSYCSPKKSIEQQIIEGIEFHQNRYRRANKYLAYFQAYSNTYGPVSKLEQIFNKALKFKEIIGLVIGTRPDCIDEEKIDLFKRISQTHYVIIEYGIESCYNNTLVRINRGHSFEDSVKAIDLTSKAGIRVGAHLIFGLPGETKEEMLNEASIISKLPLTNVKFHQLQIIRNTKMAEEYKLYPDNFTFFDLDKYLNFMVDFLEKLNPAFVVERFTSEVPPRFLVDPGWGLIRNDEIIRKFEKLLEERNTWQGRLYKC